MPAPLPLPDAPDVAYLLDLSSLARGLFETLKPMTTADGEPVVVTSAIVTRLVKILALHRPAFLGVCADCPTAIGDEESPEDARRRRYWRAREWPGYKAGREPPGPEYDTQIDRLFDIFHAHRIPVFRAAGFEADDFFGALVPKLRRLGLRVLIVSKDHDLWQLLGRGVGVWDGVSTDCYFSRDVEAKYGVPPGWLAALLALAGDGDEAPGLPGVGLARAAKLIARHVPQEGAPLDAAGVVERVLARWQWETTAAGKLSKVGEALRAGGELARLSLRLVELREAGVPVVLDLSEMRVGWGEDDAERIRALGAELSIADMRAVAAQPKKTMPEALVRRWLEAEASEERA